MTKEEAIHVINQVRDIITKSPSWMEEATRVVNEAAEIAIKALEAQEWIPCSERPPEPDEEVFVYLWGNVPYIASMNGEGQWDTEYFCVDVKDSPKAWMPLPEPYKEEIE